MRAHPRTVVLTGRKHLLGILAGLVALSAIACSSGAEGAARQYMEAISTQDIARAQSLTCSSQQLQNQLGLSLMSLFGGQQVKAEIGGLQYQNVRSEGDTAQVRVSGPMKVSAFGQTTEQKTSFTLVMRKVGSDWLYCGSAP